MRTIHFENQVVIVISKNVATLKYLNKLQKTYKAEVTIGKDDVFILLQKPITINYEELVESEQ